MASGPATEDATPVHVLAGRAAGGRPERLVILGQPSLARAREAQRPAEGFKGTMNLLPLRTPTPCGRDSLARLLPGSTLLSHDRLSSGRLLVLEHPQGRRQRVVARGVAIGGREHVRREAAPVDHGAGGRPILG